MTTMALLRKVDCVRLYVPDLEAGLAFYRDSLGHELIWRTETTTGLRLPDTELNLSFKQKTKDRKWISWWTRQMNPQSWSNRPEAK